MDAAEHLFMQRGFASVRLRDIADALEIRQASLYYHFPEGKEQLYVAVVERALQQHAAGLRSAAATAGPGLPAQLRAVAAWFAQHPISASCMIRMDMAHLSPASAQGLSQLIQRSLFPPLRHLFQAAQQRGEIRPLAPELLAGMMLALLEGLATRELTKGEPATENASNRRASTWRTALRRCLARGRAGRDAFGADGRPAPAPVICASTLMRIW